MKRIDALQSLIDARITDIKYVIQHHVLHRKRLFPGKNPNFSAGYGRTDIVVGAGCLNSPE
ncbi:hypothetical protein [Chryseobacterium sp. RR2-3-20]|uniref:hypothetical protein n=1 Tax=Chryseobacterium sp. RR2-3-20 TaxID=2787626 RepID=UPI001AE054B8|nr:hypothetical protein [Chryseobacterium sp. RR2-3-20]